MLKSLIYNSISCGLTLAAITYIQFNLVQQSVVYNITLSALAQVDGLGEKSDIALISNLNTVIIIIFFGPRSILWRPRFSASGILQYL